MSAYWLKTYRYRYRYITWKMREWKSNSNSGKRRERERERERESSLLWEGKGVKWSHCHDLYLGDEGKWFMAAPTRGI